MTQRLFSTNSVLNKFIHAEFTKDQYGKDASATTHYLIIYNNLPGLKTWLSNAEKVANRVTSCVTKMQLSPLHMCCMLGREAQAHMLIETGKADINAKDARGWTALHFAALINSKPLVELLLKIDAVVSRNIRGGTYLDILQLCHTEIDPAKQVCHYMNEKREVVKGTGLDFVRLTGAKRFLDCESTTSPEMLTTDWLENSPKGSNELITPEQYSAFRRSPPKFLYLQKDSEHVGWEIYTGQDIAEGEIMVEYLGNVAKGANEISFASYLLDSQSTGEDYTFGDINANAERSFGAIISDSLPNVLALPVWNCAALRERAVFQALHLIPKGTKLRFDYGMGHRIKLGVHIEGDTEDLENYFRAICKSADSLENAFERQGKTIGVQGLNLYSKLMYLIDTPASMMKLVLKRIVPMDAIEKLMRHPGCAGTLKSWSADFPHQWIRISEFIQTLSRFAATMDKLPPEKIQELIKATDTHSAYQLMRMMRGEAASSVGEEASEKKAKMLQAILKQQVEMKKRAP